MPLLSFRTEITEYGRGIVIASEHKTRNNSQVRDETEKPLLCVAPKTPLFLEIPVETVPTEFSRICCRLCDVCLRPLGTFEERARRILRLDPDPAQRSLTRSQTKGLQRLWTAFLQTLYEPAEADHNQLGCSSCDALVCSFSCLELLESCSWHRVTCPSQWQEYPCVDKDEQMPDAALRTKRDVRDAWLTFVRYARKHFEGFLLTARLLCRIAVVYETNALDAALRKKSACLSYQPLDSRLRWSDVRTEITDSKFFGVETPPLALSDQENSCQKSFLLLKEFFDLRASYLAQIGQHASPFHFDTVQLDDTYYSQLLVQCERVNADLAFEDPVVAPLKMFFNNTENFYASKECLEVFAHMSRILYPTSRISRSNHVDLITSAFHDVMGYSYLPVVGLLNHSCEPNTGLEFSWSTPASLSGNSLHGVPYLQWTPDGLVVRQSSGTKKPVIVCKAYALKELRNGDQLLLSYVDENQSLAVRSRQLKTQYGFTCRCSKCRNQALEARANALKNS